MIMAILIFNFLFNCIEVAVLLNLQLESNVLETKWRMESTYCNVATRFSQGSAATQGKLKQGKRSYSVTMRWCISHWSGGSYSKTAQEGKREFNPGVSSGLSWSWERCSRRSVFSSEFLSESSEWSWVRLLGLCWHQAVGLAALVPLYSEEEELLVSVAVVVVLGVSMMLLLRRENVVWLCQWGPAAEHCSCWAALGHSCSSHVILWMPMECEEQNGWKMSKWSNASICRWVMSSETPLKGSLKNLRTRGCKTWLKHEIT